MSETYELARELKAIEAKQTSFEHDLSFHLEAAEALVFAGYHRQRRITTAEELDALPEGSVVLDLDGDVGRRVLGGWTTTVVEADGGTWLTDNTEVIAVPAVVIWEPAA